jgi:hypothetical protein
MKEKLQRCGLLGVDLHVIEVAEYEFEFSFSF